MDTFYIVMPAYNEEENIEQVIKQWYLILDGKSEDSRLAVADSGSNDNTHSQKLVVPGICNVSFCQSGNSFLDWRH